MAEIVHQAEQEFWRPPSPVLEEEFVVREPMPVMAEACARCGTEYLLGSHFCHACGSRRPKIISESARADAAAVAHIWENVITGTHSLVGGISWSKIKLPSWLQYLHYHEIQRRLGLPALSLVAFVIGIGCIAGAMLVGLLTAKTLVDWQAIQFYRVEWLLAATASFVAGILLKNPSNRDPE